MIYNDSCRVRAFLDNATHAHAHAYTRGTNGRPFRPYILSADSGLTLKGWGVPYRVKSLKFRWRRNTVA